jgi:CheY-like chemotaxis protein
MEGNPMEQMRILIAEDDEMLRESLEHLFTAYGFRVDTAENYCDVRVLLDANRYNLILSDNGMPLSPGATRVDRTCGLQLLAHVKSNPQLRDVPFVLHTADDSQQTKERAKQFGGIYRMKNDPEMPLADFCLQLVMNQHRGEG